jgi:hypothetical protein
VQAQPRLRGCACIGENRKKDVAVIAHY